MGRSVRCGSRRHERDGVFCKWFIILTCPYCGHTWVYAIRRGPLKIPKPIVCLYCGLLDDVNISITKNVYVYDLRDLKLKNGSSNRAAYIPP